MSEQNQLAIQQAPMFGLSTLEEAVNFAGQMAKANLLPQHLKGSPADCLRVVMQAARWQMDPFSVADKTSVISGKLMYEGQLVSAVVNARGNLAKRLDYQFTGEGDKRTLTVTGTLKGEAEPRTIELDVILARKINKNGQMQTNPDQQMCYIGARMWARRHTSELMLGVYTPDEIDTDNTPSADPENVTPVTDRPAPKERASKGVKAAKEVVVTAEEQKQAEPAAKVENIQAAMEARQEKIAKLADPAPTTPNPSPIPPVATPRVFLQEGEKITVNAKVESFTATSAQTPEGPKPFIKAVLSGGFNGEVRDKIAVEFKDGKAVAKGAWAVGETLSFQLSGVKSPAKEKTADGKPNPLFGKILVWVDSLATIESAEEMG